MFKKYIRKMLSDDFVKKMVYIKEEYFGGYGVKSYSNEGEDMILRKIFDGHTKGFYVDVGAYHPKRFSNTFFFYKQGWRGINIDAMPGSMDKFNKIRSRDINIEKPIYDKKQILTYYAFNGSALNGFSKELSEERDGVGDYFIKFTKDIETTTLEQVLDDNLPINQEIDFLSIDVEGLDFNVLKSNNFEKYKPKIILIEILGSNMNNLDDEVFNYLKQYNYRFHAKSVNTAIFINNEFYNEKYNK